MIRGTVFNIQRFAIHDGPGLRTTVFLKGCPLSCLWCHNPEGLSARPQVVYRAERCRRCESCLASCAVGALSVEAGLVVVDEVSCSLCGRCAEVCASGSLEVVGREMTVDEVVAEVEKDRAFYDESGGGVTFSGGEPLAQPEFLRALLRACRGRELPTALDTSGFAPAEVLDRVADDVDLFLFDVKAVDERRHRELTGVPNGPILRNLERLAGEGRRIIVRVPVIPGVNDDEENVAQIGEVARSLGEGQRIDLLPYHGIAVEKYRRLRRAYGLPGVEQPPAEAMARIAASLERLGLVVNQGG